jgi:two-component system chemotaxis response regulator CheY
MKCLIAEDDFAARKLLERFLSEVSECHAVVNGQEAVDAFKTALDQGEPYDLLCLDIMMPELDGHQVLQAIRELEEAAAIDDIAGVKVIMATAMHDPQHVLDAFREGCEAYIVKPVERSKLFEEMDKLGMFAKTAYTSKGIA